jgi:hypothetical protein
LREDSRQGWADRAWDWFERQAHRDGPCGLVCGFGVGVVAGMGCQLLGAWGPTAWRLLFLLWIVGVTLLYIMAKDPEYWRRRWRGE